MPMKFPRVFYEFPGNASQTLLTVFSAPAQRFSSPQGIRSPKYQSLRMRCAGRLLFSFFTELIRLGFPL